MALTNLGPVALKPKGVYSSTASYTRLDVVEYQGGSYMALKSQKGVAPTVNTTNDSWQCLAKQGSQGNVGPTGPQGVQGKTATMKVGKVSTLQPGTTATVANSGTPENAVLDFGIPRGDDGITDLVAEYKDAAEHTCSPTVAAPVVIKEIAGKTEQVQTTGYQLFDANNPDFKGSATDIITDNGYRIKLHTTGAVSASVRYPLFLLSDYEKGSVYTVAWDNGRLNSSGFNSIAVAYIADGNVYKGAIKHQYNIIDEGYFEFTVPDTVPNGSIRIELVLMVSNSDDVAARDTEYYGVRVYKGTYDSNKVWESYTGGKPGPNTDYPQDIKGVGDGGSLAIESQGIQLLDVRKGHTATNAGGVNYTNNGNGSYTRNGVATDEVGNAWFLGNYLIKPSADNVILTLEPGKSYYISGCELFSMVGDGARHCAGEFTVDSNVYPDGFKVTGVRNPYQEVGTTYNDIIYPSVIEGKTAVPYHSYHHTTATIPLSSPIYSGDKICCVQPGESYVDANGNTSVAHRVLWGVRRESIVITLNGNVDENWRCYSGVNLQVFECQKYVVRYDTTPDLYCKIAQTLPSDDQHANTLDCASIKAGNGHLLFTLKQYQKGTSINIFTNYLKSNPITCVAKRLVPYFEPFPDQSPFRNLRSTDDLTYIYTNDPLKPDITVDVAKQAAGGYLLSGYMDRSDGIMVDTITGAECVLGMEDGLLTVYEIEED